MDKLSNSNALLV